MRAVSRVGVLFAAWLALSISICFAQVDTGAILGTVTDPSGAVVPGAKVTITNEGTGAVTAGQTRGDGTYIFTPVRIGTYTISIQATGFQLAKQSGVTVSIQQQVVADITLTPGNVSTTIEVKSTMPLLQTQSGSVGEVVETKAINNLPLNGRNYNFLARLSTGVTYGMPGDRGQNATGWFTANGNRPAQNNFLLDGIDNNTSNVDFLSGAAYVLKPPVDAVNEFKLQTSAFSAEFGRAAGAVLNATLKSGTNDFHGSAWEFVRNDKLDAADFFQNANNKPRSVYKQNQFGATAGGRIVRNKLFWFGDFEGTRIRQEALQQVSVPTVAERDSGFTDFSDLISLNGNALKGKDADGNNVLFGQIFDPASTRPSTVSPGKFVRDTFPGNKIPASRIDPLALALMKLYPAPTNGALVRNYVINRGNTNDTNSFDTRIDYNINEKDFMFGRYSFSNNPRFTPGPFDGYLDGSGWGQGTQSTRAQGAALSETHAFSATLINEFRLGFNREHTGYFQNYADEMGIPDKFGIPGVTQGKGNGGLPTFAIGGLQQMGSPGWLASDRFSNTYQISENLTKIYGSHTFKGGFELQQIDFPWLAPPTSRGNMNFNGQYASAPGLADGNVGRVQFLLKPAAGGIGGPNQVNISNFGGVAAQRDYRAFYFQDDWKVSRKLTLNLGIRADHFSPTGEKYGAQGNIVPGTHPQFLIPTRRQGKPALSQSFIDTLAKDGIELKYTEDYGSGLSHVAAFDWAPRIAFAYQAASKLVVRGGYGIYFGSFENRGGYPSLGYNYPFQYEFGVATVNDVTPVTFADSTTGSLAHGFTGIPLDPSRVKGTGLALRGIQFDYKTAYTQSINFTVQYEFVPGNSVDVGYVSSLARHLEAYPGYNVPSVLLPNGANYLPYIPYPDFGYGLPYATTDGSSHYHSLQTKYTRRMAKGFDMLVAFTWGKTITNAGDPLTGGNISGARSAWLSGFGYQKEMALASYDIRRAFSMSGTYELPFGRGRSFMTGAGGVQQALLGGWSTNWILTYNSGQPQTIGCPSGTGRTNGCFAFVVPGQDLYNGGSIAMFYNPAAFAQPPMVQTAGQSDYSPLGGYKTPVTGPPFHQLDLSLFKQFGIAERLRSEVRAEAFNLSNTPSFANPSLGNFKVPGTFSPITGTKFSPNGAREIQLALKFYF